MTPESVRDSGMRRRAGIVGGIVGAVAATITFIGFFVFGWFGAVVAFVLVSGTIRITRGVRRRWIRRID